MVFLVSIRLIIIIFAYLKKAKIIAGRRILSFLNAVANIICNGVRIKPAISPQQFNHLAA